MDIKLSKAHFPKIIQSGGFLPILISTLGTLGKGMAKGVITDLTILLAKHVLPGLVSNMASNATSNVIYNIGRKISGRGAVRAGRGFALFISNEDMDDICKIVESLGTSGLSMMVLMKHEIKNKKVDFFLF